jgi:MFS family permease
MNALSLRHFALYFWTNTLSLLGIWIQKIGLGWLTWQITESTFWTSFVSIALMAPVGLISPFIAVYAENWDMRRAMLVTKIMMMAVSFLIFILQWFEMHTLHSLVLASLALGVLSALHHPVRLVFITIVVPKPYLPSAIGLNSVSWNMSRIIGPAMSGFAIVALGLAPTFGIAMLCYLPLVCALLVLPLQERKVISQKADHFIRKLLDGGREARTSPLIFASLCIVAINSFFVRGVLEIQPAIVGQILDGDSSALAIVTSAAGLGSLLASGWIGMGRMKPEFILKNLWPMLAIGLLATISLNYATHLVAMSVVFVFSGFTATVVGIGAQTLIQLEVSEGYRERVMTWWSSVSFGSLTIGGIVIGFFGDLIPIEYAIFMITFAGIGLSGLALVKLPLLKTFWHGK